MTLLTFWQINTPSSLLSLGSLIGGIPSTVLTILSPKEILETSKNTEFVKNIVAAPEIVQRTFVSQVGEQHLCILRDISSANDICWAFKCLFLSLAYQSGINSICLNGKHSQWLGHSNSKKIPGDYRQCRPNSSDRV